MCAAGLLMMSPIAKATEIAAFIPKVKTAGSVIQAVQEIPGLPNTQVKGRDSTRKRAFLVNRR